jgi:hypothetical protein
VTRFFDGPKIDVVARSGMLCVTVHPTPNWQAGLFAAGSDVLLGVLLYHYWPLTTVVMRVVWIFAMISALLGLIYQLLGEEVMEIDSRKLTIRIGIHGWEQTREYQINECSNLQWRSGHRGGSYLGYKVGSWPKTFAKNISEADGDKVLSALRQALPDVAQQICASPGDKEHFVTLRLGRQ